MCKYLQILSLHYRYFYIKIGQGLPKLIYLDQEWFLGHIMF